MGDSKAERRDVRFHGYVQGVGFRYTTQRLARGRPVTGFVRNLTNGTVQVVVEGSLEEIQAFIQVVREAMAQNISEVLEERLPATGEFADFSVRR